MRIDRTNGDGEVAVYIKTREKHERHTRPLQGPFWQNTQNLARAQRGLRATSTK